MRKTSFGLSFTAVDVLAQALRVNCRLYPFTFPSFGVHQEDRGRIAGEVFTDLELRGLARDGDLGAEVETGLRTMAEPEIAVAVVGGHGLYARVSAAAGRAVVVVQEDNGLWFDLIRPETMARAVVHLLPIAPAGLGRSVTYTQPAAKPAVTEQSFRRQVRVPRSNSDAARRAAEEILRRPRRSTGYLVVTGFNSEPAAVSWIDTEDGRYVVRSTTNDQGDLHISCFPVDDARLTDTLLGILMD